MDGKNNLDPVSYTLARPSITAAMDQTEWDVRLHNVKKQIRKAESKIDSYTACDVSPFDKDEYAIKLKEISDKVEATTDELDEFIIDVETSGYLATELNKLKDGFVQVDEG